MRIGIYTPYLDTMSGGEKYMLTLALCLAKYHTVSLLWDKQQEQTIRSEAKRKFSLSLEELSFAENLFAFPLLKRLQKSNQYDALIYLSDGSIPFVSCKLFLHFQFPVQWVNGKTLFQKIKMWKVNGVFCNSAFTKKYIDKTFGITSTVLYPPVTLKETEEKKENIVLHVGRFGVNKEGVNYKKQDVMIDTYKKLYDKQKVDWKFVLVIGAKEEDKPKVHDLISRAKGYPIEIVISPSDEILWELYGKAKIYWHASGFAEDLEKYPEKAEHFGIATVEAMGVGAVPVVINAGGQKEIVDDGENGFLWNTPDELIEKTLTVMEKKDVWETLSHAARKKAKVFAGERFCEEVQTIIR